MNAFQTQCRISRDMDESWITFAWRMWFAFWLWLEARWYFTDHGMEMYMTDRFAKDVHNKIYPF